jgi:hypothetical protein
VTPAYSPSIDAEYSRKQSKYSADKALELVHGDLSGPVKPATPGGRRYFLLLVDDATRYMWVLLLTAKSEASSAIKRIQAVVEKECGRKIRVLRTDNGGSSRRPSSPPIVLMRGSLDTFRHHTPRSRMGWWSGEIRLWWQWRGRS